MRFYRMIGNNINSLMKKSNISNEQFAEKTGFSKNDIIKLLNGRLLLVPDDFKAICETLSVKTDDILRKHDDDVFVHCMCDFSDINNREKILDLIDSYIDIREMV